MQIALALLFMHSHWPLTFINYNTRNWIENSLKSESLHKIGWYLNACYFMFLLCKMSQWTYNFRMKRKKRKHETTWNLTFHFLIFTLLFVAVFHFSSCSFRKNYRYGYALNHKWTVGSFFFLFFFFYWTRN